MWSSSWIPASVALPPETIQHNATASRASPEHRSLVGSPGTTTACATAQSPTGARFLIQQVSIKENNTTLDRG